jgi:hypothetical protein
MAQIHVNGSSYELVTLGELTLDEAITVYEYAKVTLDQIPDMEGFHPGITAALIHISVARGEPGETQKTIRRTVGAIPVVDLQKVFADISVDTEDAELPPPQGPGAPPSSGGSSNGSGAASSTPGEPAPDSTEDSGTGGPGSDTGATSDPVTSAA